MHFYSNSFEEENLRKDSFLPPATHPSMQHRSMPIVRSNPIREEYRDRFSIPVEKNLRSASIEEDQPLRIHVGNIPFLWTIDDLRKQFLVFGPVKDPEIVSNERGSKGFGFITFLRSSDGMNAIRVKNGSIADGRKITVALASSRSSNRPPSHSHYCCCSCKTPF